MTNKLVFGLQMLLALSATSTIAPQFASADQSGLAETERRVVEVRYVGLRNITPHDLESSMPFSPGDSWRDGMAAAASQAIQDYYAKRGFYHTKIEVRPSVTADNNVVLMIRIDENQPCLIKSLWIDDPPGFKGKHVMLRFKAKMADILSVRAGDRYDEQILVDRLRELREWLVGEDFILANTERVRLTYNDDRTEVGVVLAIDYGDRVTFGFQGNALFTLAELNELISQVRATGIGKDYVGTIQRKIIDEYHGHAYNHVSVEPRYGEQPYAKHVTFVVNEGLRERISDLRWEGLGAQSVERARDILERGGSRLIQRGYFVEKDIDKLILLVLEDLKSHGYLSSKLISKNIQPVSGPRGDRRVRIVVQIAEGEQTVVGKIALGGFNYFSEQRIRSTLGIIEEKAFNPFMLEEGLQQLRGLYLSEGFLEFKIITPEDGIIAFTDNNRTANVHVNVTEGQRIRIGKIKIDGLQKTREYVVSRELLVREGDWWLGPNLQDTSTNIRKLGLFSDVKLTPQPSLQGPGYRDLLIHVIEAEPGAFEVGPGYRSDLGFKASSRLSYSNILGKNWIGSLGAQANRRMNNDYRFIEYEFDATFLEPRFLGTRNLYSIGLSTKKQRFPPDFNAVTTQFFTGLERKLLPTVTGKLFYKLERIRQFDVIVHNQLSPIDNRSMLIGSLVPSITLDTRDNPFTTTSGWLLNGQLEHADPRFSGQSISDSNAYAYQKWTGSVHRYTSVTKDIIWSKVISAGFVRSNVAGRNIPLIKLFRLGGYSTIRGFQEDNINVDDININGTLAFLNLRTQFDLPLVGDLKVAPFLDAGNLFIDNSYHKKPFFRAGAGLGLHYTTPVGPINLDWGHKINPTGDEAPNQIHFSVGLI